jgi:hypothetical protein
MPHMQRRTTWMLAALVAAGQLAGAIGFYWYFNQAISDSTSYAPGTFLPDAASATWSATWAKVYLCSFLAAVVLISVCCQRYENFVRPNAARRFPSDSVDPAIRPASVAANYSSMRTRVPRAA